MRLNFQFKVLGQIFENHGCFGIERQFTTNSMSKLLRLSGFFLFKQIVSEKGKESRRCVVYS